VSDAGSEVTRVERREISARRELIVSKLQTTGNSTALKQKDYTHELMVRERHPGADRVTGVVCDRPAEGSPRKL